MSDNKSINERRVAATPRGVPTATAIFADRAENAELWCVEGQRGLLVGFHDIIRQPGRVLSPRDVVLVERAGLRIVHDNRFLPVLHPFAAVNAVGILPDVLPPGEQLEWRGLRTDDEALTRCTGRRPREKDQC